VLRETLLADCLFTAIIL